MTAVQSGERPLAFLDVDGVVKVLGNSHETWFEDESHHRLPIGKPVVEVTQVLADPDRPRLADDQNLQQPAAQLADVVPQACEVAP